MDIFVIGFLLIPVVAISAKELFGWKRSLWLIFFVCVLFGWMLWALSIWSSQQQMDELVTRTQDPPKELLDGWQNDGATNVFALYFGWAIAAVYFLACLVFVRIVSDIRNALRKTK